MGTVRVTPVYGDCQSNSGVRGYSDMGGKECGPGTVRVTPVYGDCQSNSGIWGLSE